MTEVPTTKENKTGIGNWLAGWFATQYSERVDWLWFGSMLLVIGGTAIKFGPGYVPLFVALKGVLFVRFFQKEISKLPLPIVITGKPEPVKSKLNLWLIGIFNAALLSLYWIIRGLCMGPVCMCNWFYYFNKYLFCYTICYVSSGCICWTYQYANG